MTLKLIIGYIPNRFRYAFLFLFLLSLGSILIVHLNLLPSLATSSSSSGSPVSHPLAMMDGPGPGGGGGGGNGNGDGADVLNSRVSQRVEGLKAHGKDFELNKRPFFIASGALHYFRVVPEYWLDRLTKLKAAGWEGVKFGCSSILQLLKGGVTRRSYLTVECEEAIFRIGIRIDRATT